MKDRVEYYSRNDWCYGMNLDKIETLDIPDLKDISINDAIEFHEIRTYFEDGVRSKTWSDTDLHKYKEKSLQLDALGKRFFSQICDENIIDLYANIELGYHSRFWLLFDICKLYNGISENIFSELIRLDKVSPYDLFKYKDIVKKYGCVLRQYILNDNFCVPILLHVYEQDYTDKEKLFLPRELSGEDICTYLEKYVDGPTPNSNYLSEIENMSSTKMFFVSDELKLKARRRYNEEMKKCTENGVCVEYGVQVAFDSNQIEEKKIIGSGKDICLSYGVKWFEETLDYPSILNNFIYIFEFVDLPQMRSNHVCKKSNSGLFETLFSSRSSRHYHINHSFKAFNAISVMQMMFYYDFLERKSIRLEDVLHWFFTEYLQNEFECPEMRVLFPSVGTTYCEKCSSIITAFEGVIKQFLLLAKNGNIDFELVAMSTKPTLFENVGSLVDRKYVYGDGKVYNDISFMLFSDQCLLSHLNRVYEEGRHYDCLIDMLLNETIFLSDYRKEEKPSFEYLERYELITIDQEGKIEIGNKVKISILRNLYNNDVINKKHCSDEIQKGIDELLESGVLVEESTLFSRSEVDYLNYLLNRSEFVNGLEIRNKYIHGMQQVNLNEDEHRRNYFTLLKLFVLLAIKINDEFCIRELEGINIET